MSVMSEPANRPRSGSFYAICGKRLFDILLSAGGLLVFALPMACVSVLILLASGAPVFFRQERIGQHGKRFRICKFRTMTNHPLNGSTVTVAGDARLTTVGSWLRRLKVDEFPQLANVLRGNMSFVGPRPDVPGYADRLIGGDARLLELRPGITGPATVVFRDEEILLSRARDPFRFNDEVLYPAKVRINLDYLNRISFCEDVKLILLTMSPMHLRHPERERVVQALKAASGNATGLPSTSASGLGS